MIVAITGADGFVGRALVAALLVDAPASALRGIVRDPVRARSRLGADIDLRRADVTDPASLRGAFDRVDAIVHTVAIPTERRARFDDVNVQGTRSVLAEAERAGVRRFVHIGAIGARADSPYPFLRGKGLAEQAVAASRIPSVVLRPSVLFGPGDDFFPRLGFSLRFPVVPVPGDGKARFQPLHVEDLALAVRSALDRTDVVGAHEIGGPSAITYDELLAETMRGYGKRRPTLHLPVLLMKPAALVMGLVMADPPVTLQQLDLLAVDNTPSENAIERLFGIHPRRFDLTYLSA